MRERGYRHCGKTAVTIPRHAQFIQPESAACFAIGL